MIGTLIDLGSVTGVEIAGLKYTFLERVDMSKHRFGEQVLVHIEVDLHQCARLVETGTLPEGQRNTGHLERG